MIIADGHIYSPIESNGFQQVKVVAQAQLMPQDYQIVVLEDQMDWRGHTYAMTLSDFEKYYSQLPGSKAADYLHEGNDELDHYKAQLKCFQ